MAFDEFISELKGDNSNYDESLKYLKFIVDDEVNFFEENSEIIESVKQVFLKHGIKIK